MGRAAERLRTFDELYAVIAELPEGVTGEILHDGELETMSRPGRGHTRAGFRLAKLLGPIEDEDERDGWVFAPEREIRLLTKRLVVPDLSGFIVAGGDDAFLDENPILRRPDWACEILSQSTERKDRIDKLPLYARADVPHVWLIDAEARFIEVYASKDGLPVQVAVARESEVAQLPPFVGLELPLGRLWGRRR